MNKLKNNSIFICMVFLIVISLSLSACQMDAAHKDAVSMRSEDSQADNEAVLTSVPDVTAITNEDTEKATVEVKKDIDSDGIPDSVQRVTRNDGSEAFLRVFLNGEQIYEFKDPNARIMSVDAFEYLDLDEDDIGEILISAYTDANCRPLSDVLCLKQSEGQWQRMEIPLNGNGNNEFKFRITRGEGEFDFIISSEDTEEEIRYDASRYFVDDESGNIDSIQAYRSNHYQEGDEVGFISAWGIWSARAGTCMGRDCVIALQGIEGPYGHGLGQLEISFAYDRQGMVEILKVEYLPE